LNLPLSTALGAGVKCSDAELREVGAAHHHPSVTKG
jgi:hypothetical protein